MAAAVVVVVARWLNADKLSAVFDFEGVNIGSVLVTANHSYISRRVRYW